MVFFLRVVLKIFLHLCSCIHQGFANFHCLDLAGKLRLCLIWAWTPYAVAPQISGVIITSVSALAWWLDWQIERRYWICDDDDSRSSLSSLQHTQWAHVLSTALVGQVSSEEFGCPDLERLQNISVYRLSPMGEPCCSLPARHAAVNLVGNQNKGEGRAFCCLFSY